MGAPRIRVVAESIDQVLCDGCPAVKKRVYNEIAGELAEEPRHRPTICRAGHMHRNHCAIA
jgi:hypothetical protein